MNQLILIKDKEEIILATILDFKKAPPTKKNPTDDQYFLTTEETWACNPKDEIYMDEDGKRTRLYLWEYYPSEFGNKYRILVRKKP